MDTFGDSNCHSMSDNFSLYERYLRSFNVVDSYIQENHNLVPSPSHDESSSEGNIDLSDSHKHCETSARNILLTDSTNLAAKVAGSLDADFCSKAEDNELASAVSVSLLDNSWITAEHSLLTEKSDATDVPVSSEDSKSNCFKNPVFISSTMENSNNAVDSVPLFHTNPCETVFKLPIRELSFNGTIKHVQKLKPIVDPITALTSEASLVHLEEKVMEHPLETLNSNVSEIERCGRKSSLSDTSTESPACSMYNRVEKCTESTNDSQYKEAANDQWSSNVTGCQIVHDEGSSSIDLVTRGQIATDEGSSNIDFVTKGQIGTDERSSDIDHAMRGEIATTDENIDLVTRGQIAIDEGSSNIDLVTRGQTVTDEGSSDIDHVRRGQITTEDESSNRDQSYSSMEASFDSGVRSPDIFSDEDAEAVPTPAPQPSETFWSFLKDFEAYDKKRVRKLEETLQGILPPPSVTTLKTDVTEMLKKYYGFLPLFNGTESNLQNESTVPKTPSKRVSFVQIPSQEPVQGMSFRLICDESSMSEDCTEKAGLNTSADKIGAPKLSTETEMKETTWPDILKHRYYDVNYNLSPYCERVEILSMRYGERFVGAETDTSLTVWAGGLHSPSSASKRKELRLKMAQAKSPGRRLSHLARRRQAFASAATVGEKAHSTARMVLIDKKKLVSSERKSPRARRTPGKKTPTRKTPGKKTPRKTPKSGGSSKKKAMRRLLMDTDTLTRSQPQQNTIKRALFISPDNRKPVPQIASSSVPVQVMKSKRALFSSPSTAETKSLDGTASDQFMKRKLSALDEQPETSRSKIAKSLSFGGDTIAKSLSFGGDTFANRPGCSQQSFSRRASEFFANKSSGELSEAHKKKLLWAASEALRAHGWRMSSPGFRDKMTLLFRLTRRLLALPPHAARLHAPNASTSATMLKLARQYVFAIIQGRSVEECYLEEQAKLNGPAKVTGYISAAAYQQMRSSASTNTNTCTSQVKENLASIKPETKSNSKNILQDKLVNIPLDANSNSNSSSLGMLDKTALFKSNSMPSFEAAKMRARRQISFDNVDFPKR